MQAEKLPSGKWRARAYNKLTGQRKSFTSDSKKEAERLARQYQYNVKEEAPGMLFSEAYDLYIQAHPKWSVRTIADYTNWKDSRYSKLLPMKLDDITDAYLQKWIDEKVTEMSAKSVINIFTPIRATLKRYRPYKPILVSLPQKDKAKLNLPSEADVTTLMQSLENTEYFIPLCLSSLGAMRRGEIASLKLDHIDFEQRTIFVEHNMARDKDGVWHLKPPKNGCTRTITVPQVLIDRIKKYGLPEIRNPDQFSTQFKRYRRNKKLPDFNLHSMRHFCAAKMLSLNIPISVVQEYGGWKNKTVLLEIYDYVIKEVRDKSLDLWNEQANQIGHELDTNSKKPCIDSAEGGI